MSRWYPAVALAALFGSIYFWITHDRPSVPALLLLIGSAIAGNIFVAGIRSVALERMLDVPNERSSHSSPTPRGGGAAIVLLALITLAAGAFLSARIDAVRAAAVGVTSGMIAAIGFWDDAMSASARVRLLAHLVVAAALVAVVGPIEIAALLPHATLEIRWLGFILAVMWVAGLTNAYNFMDGIDGIAACQAVVAALAWAIAGATMSDPLVTLLGIAVAGSSAGFLWHNWPPARIFMGDVGSGFLGFLFAALTLIAAQVHPRAVIAGVLFVWPFLFDTIFTFFRRLYRRENVFTAHRTHLYQRLVIAGFSHRAVTGIYAALACLCSVAGILLYTGAPHAPVIATATALASGLGIYLAVRLAE